jgi:hypothetical protein
VKARLQHWLRLPSPSFLIGFVAGTAWAWNGSRNGQVVAVVALLYVALKLMTWESREPKR